MHAGGSTMVVLIDNMRPTGIGESLSGSKAFFINKSMMEDWQSIEKHPEYLQLQPDERADVKSKYPLSVQIYKIIWSTPFY
jgi:hypothetical protein